VFDDPRWSDDPRQRDDPGRDLSRGGSDASRDPVDARDREHGIDPRDVFTHELKLPRGPEREIVWDRNRHYTLRGSETRTLGIVGSFRVVSSRDLRDYNGQPLDLRQGDLRHLREEGLVRAVPLEGRKDVAVVLTDRGRDLLNAHRVERAHGSHGHQQTFYAELKKPREVEHDVQLYSAYVREAERLQEREARIGRVVLDYELKREYQRFLQERNRDREDSDGRPDRTRAEIDEWARDHDLPYFDDQVHFPDVRIEYEEPDGRSAHEDIELVTVHYRGGHAAAAARSGFTCRAASSGRTGGRPFDPDLARDFL
jgi:hypothetical protein